MMTCEAQCTLLRLYGSRFWPVELSRCDGRPPPPGGSGRSPVPSGTSAVCVGCGFDRAGLVLFIVSVGSPGCVVLPGFAGGALAVWCRSSMSVLLRMTMSACRTTRGGRSTCGVEALHARVPVRIPPAALAAHRTRQRHASGLTLPALMLRRLLVLLLLPAIAIRLMRGRWMIRCCLLRTTHRLLQRALLSFRGRARNRSGARTHTMKPASGVPVTRTRRSLVAA